MKPGDVKRRANRLEKKAAARLPGFRRQPNSGAIPNRRGDLIEAKTNGFMLDSKSSCSDRIAITEAMLDKVSQEALRAGRRHGLLIELPHFRAVVMDQGVFASLFPDAPIPDKYPEGKKQITLTPDVQYCIKCNEPVFYRVGRHYVAVISEDLFRSILKE